MASLLVVDDDDDIRLLIRHQVGSSGLDLEIVGEAANGRDAVERWRELRPDVVVIDERMPGFSGMEVAAGILAEDPNQAILLFTAYLDGTLREMADKAGIRRCLTKTQLSSLTRELSDMLHLDGPTDPPG